VVLSLLPVVLTRSAPDNAALAALLRARGVKVIEWSATRTHFLLAPEDAPALAARARRAVTIAVTSRRGVQALERCWGPDLADLVQQKDVVAVGTSTARALEAAGIRCRALAGEGALAVAQHVAATGRGPVLLLRSATADDAAARHLRAAGFEVDDVEAYVTHPSGQSPLEPQALGVVACASPSAARSFLEAHPWARTSPFAAIGATTAAAVHGLGVERVVTAASPGDRELERAILEALELPAVAPS
jgi:uroporphyrinogen-III synthase